MRFQSRLLPLLAGLSIQLAILPARSFADGNDLTIDHVYTGWREADSFKRISEYFTGRENTGDIVVLRTHPEQRSGFYFLIKAVNPGSPAAVTVGLEVIVPNNPKPKTYAFSATLKSGANLIDLGLTAGDWTDPEAHPVAWIINFENARGDVLAVKKSYLWERPAAK